MCAALKLAALAAALAPATVHAQSISPAEVRVGSFGDAFLVRLDVLNPYLQAKAFHLAAYDEDGAPTAIWTALPDFDLNAGASRRVVVSAPFGGRADRRMLICVETVAVETAAQRIRGQVCSRVSAVRY